MMALVLWLEIWLMSQRTERRSRLGLERRHVSLCLCGHPNGDAHKNSSKRIEDKTDLGAFIRQGWYFKLLSE